MPWFFVDDAFADSKPVMKLDRALRNEAIGLWVRCGAWSAKEETDGRVPLDIVRGFGGTPRVVKALQFQAELWRKPDENTPETMVETTGKSRSKSREIIFANWDKWQKTKAENDARRKADAERQSNHRRSKKGRGYVAGAADTANSSQRDTDSPDEDMSRCESQCPDPDPTQTLRDNSSSVVSSPNVGGDERGLSVPVQPSASRLVSVLVPNTVPAAVRTGLRIRLSELMNDDGFNPDDAAEVLRRWLARPGAGVGLLSSFASDIARERILPNNGIGKSTQKALGYRQLGAELIDEIHGGQS